MTILFKPLPFTNILPDVDPPEARMFRLGGPDMNQPPSGLIDIPKAEAENELSTLAVTIMRGVYHRRRFKLLVNEAHERYEAHGGNLIFDPIAKYIAFEASGALGAARSFVDGVFQVARRRAKASLDDAEGKGVTRAIYNADAPGHALPELALLRSDHLKWFAPLNAYRNVVVHVGGMEALGFYPTGARVPREASSPKDNVMNLPDLESLHIEYEPKPGKKKRRSARPHEWQFTKGTRLETVVTEAADGLLAFARAVGAEWGTSPPARGERETKDVVVLRSPA